MVTGSFRVRDWGAPPYLAGRGGGKEAPSDPGPHPGDRGRSAGPRPTHRKRTDKSGGVRKSRRHSMLSTCCTCAPPSTCAATRLVCTASCAGRGSRKPERGGGPPRSWPRTPDGSEPQPAGFQGVGPAIQGASSYLRSTKLHSPSSVRPLATPWVPTLAFHDWLRDLHYGT